MRPRERVALTNGKSLEEIVFDMWTRGWDTGPDYEPPERLVKKRKEAGEPYTFGSKSRSNLATLVQVEPEEAQISSVPRRPVSGSTP